jgi:uncharacterized protein
MPIELPDVNVLIALLDPMHPDHNKASQWYAGTTSTGWATCPLTENGFIRILSSPSYPNLQLRVEDAVSLLEATIANPAAQHHFWNDSISLRDKTLFTPSAIVGPKQITDIYLLGLCKQRQGTLVTLDSRITTTALVSSHPNILRLL